LSKFISDSVNTHGLTIDQILDMVIRDTDVNVDGVISLEEFSQELLGRWDTNPGTISCSTVSIIYLNL